MNEYQIHKIYTKKHNHKKINKCKKYPILCTVFWGSIIYLSYFYGYHQDFDFSKSSYF